MELIFIILPLLSLPLFWIINNRKIIHVINIITASLILVVGVIIIFIVNRNGIISWNEVLDLYVDGLSAFMLGITLIISFLISIYSVGYLEKEYENKKFDLKKIKIYYILYYVFIFTMLFALTSENIGVMWVAIEATTISSVFLVGFYNDKNLLKQLGNT